MEQEAQKVDIARYWSVIRRRFGWGAMTAAVLLAATMLIVGLLPKRFTADCLLQIESETEDLMVGSRPQAQKEKIASVVARTKAIMMARTAAEQVIRDTGLVPRERSNDQRAIDLVYKRLYREVRVEPVGERLVQISYTGSSYQQAEAVLDGLLARFRERVLLEKRRDYRDTWGRNKEEVRQLLSQMEDAGKRYHEFLRQNQEQLPDSKVMKLQELKELRTRYNEAVRKIEASKEKRDFWDEVMQALPEILPRRLVAETRDIIRDRLQTELATARISLVAVRQRYTDDHPLVKMISQQVEMLQEEVMKATQEEGTPYERNPDYDKARQQRFEAQVDLDTYTSERDEIQKRTQVLDAQLALMPQVQVRADELNREIDTADKLYKEARKREQEARERWQLIMSEGGYFTDMSPPRAPQTPETTRTVQIMIAGIILSLVGGLGAMFGVEYIDQSFTAVDEARDFLRIPSLGVIPTITTRRDRRRRRAYRVLSVMLMAGIIAGFVAAYEYIPRVQYIVDSVVTAFGNMFGL
jgi:uncharacterized protein involved in exopolysaccharide biosynthesis